MQHIISLPGPGGKLSATEPLSILLEISANDDPYGVLVFPSSSTEREIAEDYYPGDNETSKAIFTVERAQGSFGRVEVRVGDKCHVFSNSNFQLSSLSGMFCS